MAYITRGPASAANNGDMFSQKTANASLGVSDWTAAIDGTNAMDVRCPRAFVPNADGTLAIRGIDDAADTIIDVKEGVVYPIAIKQITRASCSASLQIANAVALLY